ncbi:MULTISPECIES: glycosyltransferase [Acinetobacter]|uniref:glycosyltransferase n=1 Tax=Acinetobacter TaxID=469 RepID=UPI00029C959C|nr:MULTISPECIES: glycosyltransferase family A protein [Acinetobacter]EKU39426.1 glycosyltransferase-like protein, family 2 [Acinetobacter sp. WC-141]MBM7142130.1 glycosyltransferase family 2 protein [Acinetobacter sp. 105-3]
MKIGIVIPAHNEEYYLSACLQSIQVAIDKISGYEVEVIVVLDSCTDQSRLIVQSHQINWIECNYACVGQARDLGIRHLIERGVTWIACTDADTIVSPDWLRYQIQHQPTDVICGTVMLDDLSHLSMDKQQKYLAHYQDQMDHAHIHGANLSFSAEVYLLVGGFDPISCHEDVSLIKKFIKHCCNITWSNLVRVTTSSRLNGRAPQGLSYFLNNL